MLDASQKFFALLSVTIVLLLGLSTPSSATPIAHLVLHGEPGEPITQELGQSDYDLTYVPEGSTFFIAEMGRTQPSEHPDQFLRFVFLPTPFVFPDNLAQLQFGTDQLGISIQPGSYVDAQRAVFAAPGHPGLDVAFNHLGCNTITGSFTVTEASFLPGNIINSFGAIFEQHCDEAVPALFGIFTYSLSGLPVNTTVPEPSTWLLLASGIAGVVFLRRLSPT